MVAEQGSEPRSLGDHSFTNSLGLISGLGAGIPVQNLTASFTVILEELCPYLLPAMLIPRSCTLNLRIGIEPGPPGSPYISHRWLSLQMWLDAE